LPQLSFARCGSFFILYFFIILRHFG